MCHNSSCISKRDLQIRLLSPKSSFKDQERTDKAIIALPCGYRYTVYFSVDFVRYEVADNKCWPIIDNLC